MSRSKPYQPLLLRILHGLNALVVIGAAIAGFLVYDSWDGRFGKLGLTHANRALIDLHGTFGFLLFFMILPSFIIYSIKAGRKRLLQANSVEKLTQVGQPIWWYTLHRLANTLVLLAAIFAAVSGKFMDENWLPKGEFNHPVYYVHLIAWVVIGLAIALHLLMVVKVGGVPLILSMVDTQYCSEDNPRMWPDKILAWLRRPTF